MIFLPQNINFDDLKSIWTHRNYVADDGDTEKTHKYRKVVQSYVANEFHKFQKWLLSHSGW